MPFPHISQVSLMRLGELRFLSRLSAPSRSLWLGNRIGLNEEIRSRIQFRVAQLREVKMEATAYNALINTPEFSRFVFIVPGMLLAGVTAISLSPPSTMPLIFEKLIPYHIKAIAVASGFYAFADLAANVIGRPTIVSHHRYWQWTGLVAAYAALLASTGVIALADHDPHQGYKATLALLMLHAGPTWLLPMPAWIRVWRLMFLGLGAVSVLTASHRLQYLESHWDDLIFL